MTKFLTFLFFVLVALLILVDPVFFGTLFLVSLILALLEVNGVKAETARPFRYSYDVRTNRYSAYY